MIFQVSLSIFLLFFILSHSTYALQSNTRFRFDLKNFNGVLRRGDNTTIIHELKKHLMYLGYLDSKNSNSENNYDLQLENAIKKYQEFYNLNITGVVDNNTITSIRKPRCGFPDFFSPQTRFKSLYSFYEGNPKWEKTTLSYYMFETTPYTYRPAIEAAFGEWQRVSPFLFARLTSGFPDITLSFETGDHNCEAPFTSERVTLAHTFSPPIGRIHYNGALRWASDGDSTAADIESVSLHEFGHVLGLAHSTVIESVMNPLLDFGQIKRRLHEDDIEGLKTLYGF